MVDAVGEEPVAGHGVDEVGEIGTHLGNYDLRQAKDGPVVRDLPAFVETVPCDEVCHVGGGEGVGHVPRHHRGVDPKLLYEFIESYKEGGGKTTGVDDEVSHTKKRMEENVFCGFTGGVQWRILRKQAQ